MEILGKIRKHTDWKWLDPSWEELKGLTNEELETLIAAYYSMPMPTEHTSSRCIMFQNELIIRLLRQKGE